MSSNNYCCLILSYVYYRLIQEACTWFWLISFLWDSCHTFLLVDCFAWWLKAICRLLVRDSTHAFFPSLGMSLILLQWCSMKKILHFNEISVYLFVMVLLFLKKKKKDFVRSQREIFPCVLTLILLIYKFNLHWVSSWAGECSPVPMESAFDWHVWKRGFVLNHCGIFIAIHF